jgi:uncharacterized protein YlxP (DUF503 family)
MARATSIREIKTMVSLLTIKYSIPGCQSLKEKRSAIQPLISRVRKEFNVSLSEVGLQDIWQNAWIGIVCVSNDSVHNSQVLQEVLQFSESNFPNLEILEHHIENY